MIPEGRCVHGRRAVDGRPVPELLIGVQPPTIHRTVLQQGARMAGSSRQFNGSGRLRQIHVHREESIVRATVPEPTITTVTPAGHAAPLPSKAQVWCSPELKPMTVDEASNRVHVGVSESIVVPSPNWPYSLSPQHITDPLSSRAQVCRIPSARSVAYRSVGRVTSAGRYPLLSVPSPSCPNALYPQHRVETSSKMAQECDSPTWIWRALVPRSPLSDVVMSLGIVRIDPEPSPLVRGCFAPNNTHPLPRSGHRRADGRRRSMWLDWRESAGSQASPPCSGSRSPAGQRCCSPCNRRSHPVVGDTWMRPQRRCPQWVPTRGPPSKSTRTHGGSLGPVQRRSAATRSAQGPCSAWRRGGWPAP